MKPAILLAALAAFLASTPVAIATGHNVCSNDSTDVSDPFGIVGVDDPFTGNDGIYACLGTQAYGVDVDTGSGPTYGATVRVLTCSGLGCGETLGTTGAAVGSGGLTLCYDGLCRP